jgi:hypothetical protein
MINISDFEICVDTGLRLRYILATRPKPLGWKAPKSFGISWSIRSLSKNNLTSLLPID